MDFHIFLAWIPPISSWSRHPATKNQEVMQEFVQSHLVSTLNPIHEAGSCENAPIEGFQKPHSKHKYISWYVTVFKEGWLSVYSLYGVIMELYGVIWSYMELSSYPVINISLTATCRPLGHWAWDHPWGDVFGSPLGRLKFQQDSMAIKCFFFLNEVYINL